MAVQRTKTIGAIVPTMGTAVFAQGMQSFHEELDAKWQVPPRRLNVRLNLIFNLTPRQQRKDQRAVDNVAHKDR